MQKKLIALAIAGLSSVAFAQSSVTLYGVADLTMETIDAKGSTAASQPDLAKTSRLQSNSSYVGFKGSENLGNGMSALFQFETGFAADLGTYNAKGRDTFVGISSEFGTITLGNQTTATRILGNRMEILPGNTGVGTSDSLLGVNNRLTNAIQYKSADYSGFNFSLAMAPGEDKKLDSVTSGTSATNGSRTYDIGLNYAAMGWDLGYAYANYSSKGDLIGATDVGKSHLVGVGYTFDGGHKVTAQWKKIKADIIGGASTDRNAYSLQGEYMVTPSGGLIADYSVAKELSGTSNTGAKMYTVGYLQNLSKRTLVKMLYTKISNDTNAAFDFGQGAIAAGQGVGADPRALSVGIRHSF